MSSSFPIQVNVSDRFVSEIRQLAKRYRRIRLDVQPIIDQLKSGELPGDQIPGMNYPSSKSELKTVTFRKGKVAAIASFIISRPRSKSCSLRSIPNQINPILLLMKFGKSLPVLKLNLPLLQSLSNQLTQTAIDP